MWIHHRAWYANHYWKESFPILEANWVFGASIITCRDESAQGGWCNEFYFPGTFLVHNLGWGSLGAEIIYIIFKFPLCVELRPCPPSWHVNLDWLDSVKSTSKRYAAVCEDVVFITWLAARWVITLTQPWNTSGGKRLKLSMAVEGTPRFICTPDPRGETKWTSCNVTSDLFAATVLFLGQQWFLHDLKLAYIFPCSS